MLHNWAAPLTFTRLCSQLRGIHRPVCGAASANKSHITNSLSTSRSISRREISQDAVGATKSRSLSTGSERAQYQLIEEVEDLDKYRRGGYHPVQIGDELEYGRYRLIDKLGYGGYSTIWLARDLRGAKYVAVKIITADASESTREASLISSLRNAPAGRGREIIPQLLDEFWISGPNGVHKCIVTPPARMSLLDAREASTFGLFQPKVARSIIAQLVHGVAFLHGQDIVHGDLHLGNILAQLPGSIDDLSTSELYEKFGDPEPEAVVRIDGKPLLSTVPTHVYIPGWFGIRSDEVVLGEEKIILSDFGESFNPHEEPRYISKTLPLLQPPEARFSGEPLSFASDIWTLACTIWEIFGQRPLFETFFPTNDRVTKEQVDVLGVLPPEWWKKWDKRLEWFNEEGELDFKPGGSRSNDGVHMTWDLRFEYCIQEPRAEAGLEIATEGERGAFMAMLRPMLGFRPRERATAQQVLQSEWMKRWGLPAVEESRGLNSMLKTISTR